MNSLDSIRSVVCTLPGYLVYFAAMLLTAAQLAVVRRLVQIRAKAARILPAVLHFLLLFFFLAVLLNYSYNFVLMDIPESVSSLEEKVLSVPWPLYAGLELISAVLILLNARAFRRYRKMHLDANAIRHTVDLLPTGILIGDGDGAALLANLKMTELCRSLMGGMLNDAERLWSAVGKAAFREGLVHTPGGETWQFARSMIALDGKDYVQITASDMTEKYCVTEDLTERSRHLKEVQEHIRSVAAKDLKSNPAP